jgi:toxin ParE1/3/4
MAELLVRLRAQAVEDAEKISEYLALEGGEALALRFAASLTQSLAQLCDHPGIGAPLVSRDPTLHSIRRWRIADFKSYLIFYCVSDSIIEVVRVLHGTSDWWRVFDIDPG